MRREIFAAATSVLIFLLPFVSSLGSVITVGPLAVARPFAAVLVLCALAAATRWTRIASAVVGVAAVWLLVGIANLRSTENLNEWLSVALGMATALACVLYVSDRRSLRVLTRGWLVAWVLAVLPAGYEVVSGNHLPNYLEGSPDWVRQASEDAASYFVNPNAFAYFLAAAMVFVALGARYESGWLRVLSLAAVALTPPVVYVSGSRIITAVSLVIMLWAFWDVAWVPRIRRAILAIGGLLAGAASVLLASSPSAQLAIEDQLTGSGIERLNLYRNAIWMFLDSGGLGVGPGRFPSIMLGRWAPYDTGEAINPHSGVFEVLSQYGLVVGVLLGAGLVAVAAMGLPGFLRPFADPVQRFAHQTLLVTAVVMPLTSFGNSTFLPSPIPWVQVGTLLALIELLRLERAAPAPEWLVRTQPALPPRLRQLRRVLRRADAEKAARG